MSPLRAGEPAPDFALPDTTGRIVRRSDSLGRGLIIWFYPEASSPGCTDQACQFRDEAAKLTEAGYDVLGISRDSVEANARFKAETGYPYPLLSDESLEVHRLYDTYGTKSAYGKTFEGVRRSTFVLDGEGTIVNAFYNTKATRHLEMLRKRLMF